MKQNRVVNILVCGMTLLLGGQMSSPVQRAGLRQEIAQMQGRGYGVRFLDNNMVETTDPMTGAKRLKSLLEPSEAEIRTWAAGQGIPILEIDPSAIDTSRFTSWYRYWTRVPLSNGEFSPLQIADIDENGKPEIYGGYKNSNTDFMTRVYELDSAGRATLMHTYEPRPGPSLFVCDVDKDSLEEVIFTRFGDLSDFEQPRASSLPTRINFLHPRNQTSATQGETGTGLDDLDSDGMTDVLYNGSELDSTTRRDTILMYVAEYDSLTNNFRRVWSTSFDPRGVGPMFGFAINDFDGDGRKEFVSTRVFGNIHVVETTGNNQYVWTWRDSIPFTNVNTMVSGDVDGDGTPEFFIGAEGVGGIPWIVMYEKDCDNQYSPRILFRLVSVHWYPQFLISDIDGDSRLEFVVLSGANLFIFKSSADDSYYLSFYKRVHGHSIQLYQFFGEQKSSFILGNDGIDSLGLFFYADIYRPNLSVNIAETRNTIPEASTIVATYPNPFNHYATIEYALTNEEDVGFSAYSATGQLVAMLECGRKPAGTHRVVWGATNVSSGVYFLVMQTPTVRIAKKLLLLR